MDLQVKIHALLDYAIKIEKKISLPAAMFGGLAERPLSITLKLTVKV